MSVTKRAFAQRLSIWAAGLLVLVAGVFMTTPDETGRNLTVQKASGAPVVTMQVRPVSQRDDCIMLALGAGGAIASAAGSAEMVATAATVRTITTGATGAAFNGAFAAVAAALKTTGKGCAGPVAEKLAAGICTNSQQAGWRGYAASRIVKKATHGQYTSC